MSEPKEQLLKLLDSLQKGIQIGAEVDREKSQFNSRTFPAVHKGITAHVSGDNPTIRIELTDDAYSTSKEFLEQEIPVAIQQALDIRKAEAKRTAERLVNRLREFS